MFAGMLLMIQMANQLLNFLWKRIAKSSQEKFRRGKEIKRKGDELYVKWKGYDNSFNSWINKKELE